MTDLGSMFLASVGRHGSRTALVVGGQSLTYAELADRAGRLASCLAEVDRPSPALGAVYASRSMTAYLGILGNLLSGAGYVPLSPLSPDARNLLMLESSRSATLVVDLECAGRLHGLLPHVRRSLLVILPEHTDVDSFRRQYPKHRFLGGPDLSATQKRSLEPGPLAYLLFTSGSTGVPKGVMVSHANVLACLEVVWDRYAVSERDRLSQTFDLTFDLSVFDMFVTWGRGASLHVLPKSALSLPDDFIVRQELTCWFSVPTVAMCLKRARRLQPGRFPSLRLSLFCGERLPGDVAAAWHDAAPTSRLENLYGPTETTIACTHFEWYPGVKAVDGVVPIGTPFRGSTTAIVDPALRPVPVGERGELCVAGPQVTLGYWDDTAKTQDKYVEMPWDAGRRWYRTGDLAYLDTQGELIHCGRLDDQIKLRGFRIELQEVEHALRRACGSELVAVLPYPFDDLGPTGLTAVVAGANLGSQAIMDQLLQTVPEHMVPREVLIVDELPRNVSGKIDRVALMNQLKARKRL